MEHHRPGPLKQKNKIHKGPKKRIRHDSVGSIRSVRSSSGSSSWGSKKGSGLARSVRKNQLLQLRKLKREELLNARRGIAVAPVLISVLSFSDHTERLLELCRTFDSGATIQTSKHGRYLHIDLPKFRTQYQIAVLNRKDLYSSIDLAKISDVLLVIHATDVERFFSNEPELIQDDFLALDAIYHHCLPQTLHGIIGLNAVENPRQKDRIRKTLIEVLEKNYPGLLDGNQTKLRNLDTAQDLLKLFHHCSTIKRRASSYCSRRSQVLAEDFRFVPNAGDSTLGTLQVDGFVRNNPLNVNSLVYVPGFGEFQMDLIETIPVPYGDEKRKKEPITFSMRADPMVRPSLQRENPVETIFEEEMRAMEDEMKEQQSEKKKVPKGTSDYQAAWIIESDDEEENVDDATNSEKDEDEIIEKIKRVQFAPIEPEEDDDGEDQDADMDQDGQEDVGDTNANYDQEMNLEEEKAMLSKFKEERMYEMFPDEIDTPSDRPARERFAKYRGLKSFRTSTWNPKENLPADYSRIFQFENFHRSRRRIFKSEAIGADPGFYIRAHLINVPRTVAEYFESNPDKPLVLFELLAREHQMSVLNVVVKKVATVEEPIQSKERLLFHVGYRRFEARPIFSAHTTGDKHKYEKFLRSDTACVATVYGPITYPPAPVLVYKQYNDGSYQLVATGSLLDCSPDRLVIKRYVLSGHPFKINRRHAVVRYMFFNREDILWFRPVELRTKSGRHGHILEPLGTHGHMKCRFDHQLTAQDTVLMYLYKRVFPKWHYREEGAASEPIIQLTTDQMMIEEN